jgi:hypothetical protein
MNLEDSPMHRRLSIVALCLSQFAVADENLVVGGDFESIPVGSAGDDCHSTHLPSIPGWSFSSGGRIDRIRNDDGCTAPPFAPLLETGGTCYISLQGSICCGCDNNGWIAQDVATVAGQPYRLRFDVCLDMLDVLRISYGDEVLTLNGDKFMDWRTVELDFVASGPSAIRFESSSGSGPSEECWEGEGCLLDNISVRPLDGCVSDVIENGVVDGADLSAVLAVWGTDGGLYPRADTNGDGVVDGQDLATVLGGWGPCGG